LCDATSYFDSVHKYKSINGLLPGLLYVFLQITTLELAASGGTNEISFIEMYIRTV